MKTRTILLLSLVVILALGTSVTVFAHGKKFFTRHMPFGGRGDFNAERLIEHFNAELELTEDQKAQLLPLLEENFSQLREHVKDSRGGKRRELREEGRKMRQKTDAQLSEILTDEQMQKLQEMKAFRMGRGSFGFDGRGGGPFQRLVSGLQLSEEQQKEMSAILDAYRETRQKGMQHFPDMRAALSEMLTQETFDEQKARELFRQQAPQLEERFVERAEMLAELRAVLSPEQVNMLQEKGTLLIDVIERRHGTRR